MSQPPAEPSWAEQNITRAPGPSKKKIAGIGCATLAGAVIVLTIIGAIVGPPKKDTTTPAAKPVAAPPSSSAPASPSSATPTPSAAPSVTASTAASASPAPATTAPAAVPPLPTGHSVAPAANRQAAAAALHANVQHYRDSLASGRATWGTPDFGPWKNQALMDLSYQDAFSQADKQFTADTEPDAISTWRDDVSAAGDALNHWATAALDAAGRSQSPPPADDVLAALATADKDADAVAAG